MSVTKQHPSETRVLDDKEKTRLVLIQRKLVVCTALQGCTLSFFIFLVRIFVIIARPVRRQPKMTPLSNPAVSVQK